MSAANAGFSCDQHAHTGGNARQTRKLCNCLNAFADNCGVHCAVCTQDKLAEPAALLRAQEIRALLFHFGLHGGDHVLIADNRLFRGADRTVVKGFGIHDPLGPQAEDRRSVPDKPARCPGPTPMAGVPDE